MIAANADGVPFRQVLSPELKGIHNEAHRRVWGEYVFILGDIFLEDVIGEAWTDDSPLLIYDPYLMENVDAATEIIMGVGISTIDASSYGFIQVGGHCPAVYVGGTTAIAVTINEPIVPGATVTTDQIAGAGQGASGSEETNIMTVAASPVMALQSVNADTVGYVEAYIKGLV